MSVFLWIVLAIIIVSLITHQISRSPLIVALIFFLVFPIGLSIYWTVAGIDAYLFQYAKVYSVSLGALLVTALRYKNWINFSWLRLLGYLLLIINILEAMLTEAAGGGIINVIAGSLLILCQAFPNQIFIDPEDKSRHLRYALGTGWIIAYTIWDFTFVYGLTAPNGFTGESAAFAICHLAVPLLLMGQSGNLYMQARVYSLSLFMMVRISWPYEPFVFLVPDWYHPAVHLFFQWVSLIVATGIVLRNLFLSRSLAVSNNVMHALAKKLRS